MLNENGVADADEVMEYLKKWKLRATHTNDGQFAEKENHEFKPFAQTQRGLDEELQLDI